MLTIHELAKLSAASYADKKSQAKGMQCIARKDKTAAGGFRATAYLNKKQVIIVFNTKKLRESAEERVGACISQVSDVEKFIAEAKNFVKDFLKSYKAKQLILTGHSVGAVYAEICAVIFKTRAVTFESLGSKKLLKKIAPKTNFAMNDIVSFLSAPNALNTHDEHVARMRYRIYIDHVDGVTTSHFLQCLWGSTSRFLMYGSLGAGLVLNVGMSAGAQAVSTSSQRMLLHGSSMSTLARKGMMPGVARTASTLAKQATSSVGASAAAQSASMATAALSASVAAIVGKRIAMQVVPSAEWTMKQHSIDSILAIFSQNTRAPKTYRAITEWPILSETALLSMDTLKNMVQDAIPLSEANRGLHMLSKENRVIEAQIENQNGYAVLPAKNPALTIDLNPNLDHNAKQTSSTRRQSPPKPQPNKKLTLKRKSRPQISHAASSNEPTVAKQPTIFKNNKRPNSEQTLPTKKRAKKKPQQKKPVLTSPSPEPKRNQQDDDAFLARFSFN